MPDLLGIFTTLITGTTTDMVSSKGVLTVLAQQANADSGILGNLRGLLQGVIPVMYPAGIAVVVLFGGYALVKHWYHRRF